MSRAITTLSDIHWPRVFMEVAQDRTTRRCCTWRTGVQVLAVWVLALSVSLADEASQDKRESLGDIGTKYGLSAPVQHGDGITMTNANATMVFTKESRKLMVNDVLIWMNGEVVTEKHGWTVSRADALSIVAPLARSGNVIVSTGMPVNVVIDPGHGGSDTGAIGTRGTKEKDLVLDIANRIGKHLESYGVNTKLTRGKDSFLSLSARTAKADKMGADILVSVHLNSARNPDTEGIETYTLPAAGHPSTAGNDDDKRYSGNKNDKANTLLAYHVHKQMLALCGGADRGIRHARFDVLQNASCPAILVECGFISNKGEEAKLQQAEHREKIAKGITRGVLRYTGRNKTEQGNK